MRLRKRMLEELDQDIRDHIELETHENIERGLSPEQARYAALGKFGNVTRVTEETRAVWSSIWLSNWPRTCPMVPGRCGRILDLRLSSY